MFVKPFRFALRSPPQIAERLDWIGSIPTRANMFSTFRRLFSLERKSALASSPELLCFFGAVPTAAGAPVTAETALRSPTTAAACRVIAEAVGSLPIHLYRRGAGGARDRETEHPAAGLMVG